MGLLSDEFAERTGNGKNFPAPGLTEVFSICCMSA